ncbi:hypothetical protein PI23P_08450 [Polaribacter irgensii 23-P]|uniref:DUF3494 domain-containing protein n=1 Tax=Polaribacter irgensii 23-P TaxID=313594 RepID=A4BZP9_9FLAO|nr:ice-binding family protein [Polaribacter irgensii]EAR12642.1 hypothetical protein PI23P_08450 [Polaribacter irgensii 23-P]
MKSKLNFLGLLIILMISSNYNIIAQSVGISNAEITPDPSSILEMRTNSKGMLTPRMTTAERNNITSPATGLILYNTTTNLFTFYNGNSWVDWVRPAYLSVDAGTAISTSSTSYTVVDQMSKTIAEAGTYSIFFNGQVSIPAASHTYGFNTSTGVSELNSIYDDIMAIPVTDTTHPLVFGSGETLFPGVYDIPGAASIANSLILDGGGDPEALFLIRATGAFNTGAGASVTLVNGASAKNVFWIADGAIGLGAGTTISGTLFSHGSAVAVAANGIVTGRLLTTSGAISSGPGALTLPTGESLIDFKTLSNFIIFTSLGGIANTGASTYTGNIGTNSGAITGFTPEMVTGNIYEAGDSDTIIEDVKHKVTFSLYKNGTLLPNSSRTRTHLKNPSDISLHGISSFAVDDIMDVRWKIDIQDADSKESTVYNRILTLIKVGN